MKKSTLLWYFTAVFCAINLALILSGIGGERFSLVLGDLLPVLCSIISVICLYTAFRSFKVFDFTKKAWLLILAGIFLYAVAEITYAILELIVKKDMNETFPSLADIFWCTGYIPLLWGMGMMFIGYKQSGFPLGNVKLYGILSVIVLILFAVIFYYVLIPIFQDPETTGLQLFFSMYYPIADIIIVIPALVLMYITSLFGRGKISLPWRYLAIGFFSFTIADLLYSYQVWQGIYTGGSLIDLFWNIGYLIMALAAIYQKQLVEFFSKGGAQS